MARPVNIDTHYQRFHLRRREVVSGRNGAQGDQGNREELEKLGEKWVPRSQKEKDVERERIARAVIQEKGEKGDMGEKGNVGEQGSMGETGQKGESGMKGGSGETGLPGMKGGRGDPGVSGSVGPKGDPGQAGPAGAAGSTGPSGPSGLPGIPGEKGEPGEKGMPGIKGDKGMKGDQGDTGVQGPVGATGAVGPKGQKGNVGAAGPSGVAGPQGPKGEGGEQGDTGEKGMTGTKGEKGVGQKGATGSQGPTGSQGEQGLPGLPSGGAVYVRWGRTTCPSGQGTELLYSGRAAGSRHNGGGVNILCMPDNPDHMEYGSQTQGHSSAVGMKYRIHSSQPLYDVNTDYVPCALCYAATRATVLTIPAKVNCPTDWIVEYTGYLMGERSSRRYSTYECVDKDAEAVDTCTDSGSAGTFIHVEPECAGLCCPPYNAEKELTCVVCSR